MINLLKITDWQKGINMNNYEYVVFALKHRVRKREQKLMVSALFAENVLFFEHYS